MNERSREEIEQLYLESEHYIQSTIRKHFPQPKAFLNAHGLDYDDLLQYARIGLYKACVSFDHTRGKTFRNFAIQSILWTIMVEVKRDSLNNISNKSLILLDKCSFDAQVLGENDETLLTHEVVGDEDLNFDEIEIDSLTDIIGEEISERVATIVKLRYLKFTFDEIGDILGVSKQAIHKLLLEHKSNLKRILLHE